MQKIIYIFSLLISLMFLACSDAGSTTSTKTTDNSSQLLKIVKKTGQIKSYDGDGNEVTDSSLKDDGYYQKGMTPSYTRASDIVTDELTSLMWQDNEAIVNVTKPWLETVNYTMCLNDTNLSGCYDTSGDTATSYCSKLSLGGYTDWRLPTLTELESIVDYSKYGPAIDTIYFNNISSNLYWSSSTFEGRKYNAWIVYFYNGKVYRTRKDDNLYVRCVRD